MLETMQIIDLGVTVTLVLKMLCQKSNVILQYWLLESQQ